MEAIFSRLRFQSINSRTACEMYNNHTFRDLLYCNDVYYYDYAKEICELKFIKIFASQKRVETFIKLCDMWT